MWVQNYLPVGHSLVWSSAMAAVPIFVIGLALGVWRTASWKASLVALASGLGVAIFVYRMPVGLAITSAVYGAAFGLFALGYLVYAAILLFDVAVASGRFEAIRRSVTAINPDGRIQALFIAFAFGAFLEGASGAGTPVAVSASLLAGIGFSPFEAAGLSLLANTAPVAFGALGLPIVTLAAVTGFPLQSLSAAAGRLCPIVAVIVPAYLIVVLSGIRGALVVWPALAICGVVFAVGQFLVSNYVGPYLTDILAALATMVVLITWLRVWRPKTLFEIHPAGLAKKEGNALAKVKAGEPPLTAREILRGWAPYVMLVVTVILWGAGPTQRLLDAVTLRIEVPFLHNVIQRTVPIVCSDIPYPAVFVFNWMGAAGTACFVAASLSAAISGIGMRQFVQIAAHTARRLAFSELTIGCVLALAYVMNYSGATATLGLAVAATGPMLPFFGAYLGWLGTFLTGSDTSANALFGPLQVVSAQALGLNPIIMCAVNTCGGVTGKMISIQNIAVAAAATGMAAGEEGKLFRFTLKHSIFLAGVVGLLALGYAYLVPGWMPAAP
jgi:L-lactate transport